MLTLFIRSSLVGGPVFGVHLKSPLGIAVPGGNVQFTILNSQATDFGSIIALDSLGKATFTTVGLAADTYVVTASYNADASDLYFPTGQPSNTSAAQQVLVQAIDQATAYVTGLYATVFSQSPDSAGLAAWVQALSGGGTRFQVAQAFWQSAEHRGLQVDAYYAAYLHRPADAEGRAVWVGAFQQGASELQVIRSFVTSPEYAQSHQGVDSFVRGLYTDVLGRAPDAGGLSFWDQALSNGRTRGEVATSFLLSGEFSLRVVSEYYQDILSRSADPSGQAYWVGQLRSVQATVEVFAESLLASDEFLQKAILNATT